MARRTLVIDNFDSFTFNLVHLLAQAAGHPQVVRPDQLRLSELAKLDPTHILISPGPGSPQNAEASLAVIDRYRGHRPILGVCLGHQCLAARDGTRIIRAPVPVHGRVATLQHEGRGLFEGIPNPCRVARYHSLLVDPTTLADHFEASAWTEDGLLMGIQHRDLPIAGVQFHPESFMTEHGATMIANFLRTS
jgi:4-amino-4-deoxychorismate synthase (2-amino-4-deoxychorismate-forming) component II